MIRRKRTSLTAQKQKPLSKEAVEQYVFGRPNDPAARHRTERHLLDDAFAADAVDGLATQPDARQMNANLTDLKLRLQQRIAQQKQQRGSGRVLPFGMQPYAVAASVALVLVCAVAVILFAKYYERTQPADQVARRSAAKPPVVAAQPQAEAPAETTPKAPEPPLLAAKTAAPKNTDEQPVARQRSENKAKTEPVAQVAETKVERGEEQVAVAPAAPVAPVPQPVSKDYSEADDKKAEAEVVVSEKTKFVNRVKAQVDKAPSTAMPLADNAAKPPATQLVRGRVLDAEDGLPIPGAVVTVHGGETVAYTDMNGEFVVTAPTDGELAFSFIGYNTYRTPVDGKPVVNARLTPDVKSLSEVVVSGTERPGAEAAAFRSAQPESGMPQFIKTVEQSLEAVPGADRFESGIIKLSFTVQPDGSLVNVKVLKSVCTECDQAAVQAVQGAARWKPAVQNGKPVPQKMRVRIPVGKKKE